MKIIRLFFAEMHILGKGWDQRCVVWWLFGNICKQVGILKKEVLQGWVGAFPWMILFLGVARYWQGLPRTWKI
jgi:hypothetical protein